MSLEEAKIICEGGEEEKSNVLHNRKFVGEVPPIGGEAASTPEIGGTPAAVPPSRSSRMSHSRGQGANTSLEKSTERRAPHGVKRCLIKEASLSEKLMGLFAAVDTAGKVIKLSPRTKICYRQYLL